MPDSFFPPERRAWAKQRLEHPGRVCFDVASRCLMKCAADNTLIDLPQLTDFAGALRELDRQDAEIATLRAQVTDIAETLTAYKEATEIVKDITYVDELNRALHREAEDASRLRIELDRLRTSTGHQQRYCSTCDGTGHYALPEDLGAKCPSCNGAGFYWVFCDFTAAQIVAEKDAEIARLSKACAGTEDEVQQIIGRALGYPKYQDDSVNFPGATAADGVCVGENVAATLAMEAAEAIARLTARVAELERA